jgi:hypothetical protein
MVALPAEYELLSQFICLFCWVSSSFLFFSFSISFLFVCLSVCEIFNIYLFGRSDIPLSCIHLKASRTSDQSNGNRKDSVFIDRKVTEPLSSSSIAPTSGPTTATHKQSVNDNSNSLWILENENTMRGGVCYYSKLYRIKHAATGRYLALRMVLFLVILFDCVVVKWCYYF